MFEISSPAVQPHDGFQLVALLGFSGVAASPCSVKPCGVRRRDSVEPVRPRRVRETERLEDQLA